MNDLEELITAHLERTAARAEPRPDLDRVFRAARTAEASTVGLQPVSPRHRHGWHRPALAVAAAVAVVAVGVAAIRLTTDNRADMAPVTRPPDGPPVDPQGPPLPVDEFRLQANRRLTDGGFAVVAGERVTLHDADGTAVAEGAFPAEAAALNVGGLEVREDSAGVVVTAIGLTDYDLYGLPDGEDCAVLDVSDGAVIETCQTAADQAFGQDLVVVTPDGNRRTLASAEDVPGATAAQPAVGSWRHAAVSPDGQWVAAQWSGECEAPSVYLIRLDDGTVLGADGGPVSEGTLASYSFLGWDDGQALVATEHTECGATESPGVDAVDPTAGTATRLLPLGTEEVIPWHLRP